jgi:hypothetical protein
MNASDIEIHTGAVDRTYREICPVDVKSSAGSLFSSEPTMAEVNQKLQEEALRLGANAVISVSYHRGMSLTSYKVLRALGTAVVMESTEVKCPACAEWVKREAVKCKHCGEAVGAAVSV